MRTIAKMCLSTAAFGLPAIGKKLVAAVFCLFGFAGAALADEKLFAAPASAPSAAPSGAGSMAQATLALVVVLIAVFAAAYGLKRLRKFGGTVGAHGIEVVSQAALGSKERAVLLKVAGTHVLVGVTPGNVNLLHVLDPTSMPPSGDSANVASANSASAAAQAVAAPTFKSLLKKSLGMS